MKTLYSLLIGLYSILIHLYSPFNTKARQWVTGRRNWRKRIQGLENSTHILWVHCASLGEFEQGRPLIEKIKEEKQGWKVVLTFFSPSGFEVRKNYGNADLIMYLPADTPLNAHDFVRLIKPDAAVFIKYEFWYNYLNALRRRKIPVYLVSAIFRPGQLFFKWYGSFYRRMIFMFDHIFVQNKESLDLLQGVGYTSCSITGDTRFDRVSQIAENARELPLISSFRGGEKLFVAGSSWDPDEEIIIRYINENPGKMKWLFAPHEIDEAHLSRIERRLQVPSTRYSIYNKEDTDTRVLIIDNIGMLSSVYRYATLSSIGGGFGKGIHNILEPACWGMPVLFGPNHKKFKEALDLIERGGANCFRSFDEFTNLVNNYLSDQDALKKAADVCSSYIAENKGATGLVASRILV